MKEISLNILDITENSIKAKASCVTIEIEESKDKDALSLAICDNGCGMAPDFLEKVTDPFVTTRTTRKVGLGLSLLKIAAESCDGGFSIDSEPNKGTRVRASFRLTHLDRMPLGDMPSTLKVLIGMHENVRFVYTHRTDLGAFTFDTEEIRQTLGDIPLSEPEILGWIGDYIQENLDSIEGGKV